MVSKVKVLVAFTRVVSTFSFLAFLTSCNSKVVNTSTSANQGHVHTHADGKAYKNEREILEKENLRIELEKKWISMRLKIVNAEKELNQAQLSKLSIEAGLARFEMINLKFPAEKGFIKEQERLSWQARLQSRQNDVLKARAQLNLYQRESDELRFKISKVGFSVPSISLVQ
jgi:hypothetical protein